MQQTDEKADRKRLMELSIQLYRQQVENEPEEPKWSCCDNPDAVIMEEGLNVCQNCGTVLDTPFVNNYHEERAARNRSHYIPYKPSNYFNQVFNKIVHYQVQPAVIESMKRQFTQIKDKLAIGKYRMNYKFIIYKLLQINGIEDKQLFKKICVNRQFIAKYEKKWAMIGITNHSNEKQAFHCPVNQ